MILMFLSKSEVLHYQHIFTSHEFDILLKIVQKIKGH